MARADDLGLVLHCPKCPRVLAFLTRLESESVITYIYACPEHGRWCVRPDGRQPQPDVVH